MIERRGVLKGILGAALATAMPALPATARERVTDALLSVRVNGLPPHTTSLNEQANGWYHFAAYYDKREAFSTFDAADMGGGGLCVVSDPASPDIKYTIKEGTAVLVTYPQIEMDRKDDFVFSCYVKEAK